MSLCKVLLRSPVAQATRQQSVYRKLSSVKANNNIKFNSKHLGKGDLLPPYNGHLRIYNMRYCPFAQRTILALNAKGIYYEVVNINLMNKPDWLFEKSAFGKVPALEIKENVTIYESLVTVEYLDDVYPHRLLLPKDPVEKAHAKIIVEASGAIHNLFFKLIKKPEHINDHNINAFKMSLHYIQEQLKSRNTKFLNGSEPGYADYMIWPWFERLRSIKDIDERAKIDAQEYGVLVPLDLNRKVKMIKPKIEANYTQIPHLQRNWLSYFQLPELSNAVTHFALPIVHFTNNLAYIDSMMTDPAVSQYLVPVDTFMKFHDGFKDENGPNYEILTEN